MMAFGSTWNDLLDWSAILSICLEQAACEEMRVQLAAKRAVDQLYKEWGGVWRNARMRMPIG